MDSAGRPASLQVGRRGDDTVGDQPVDGSPTGYGDDPRDRGAAICYYDLVARTHPSEVVAQMIPKFPYPNFHGTDQVYTGHTRKCAHLADCGFFGWTVQRLVPAWPAAAVKVMAWKRLQAPLTLVSNVA